MKILKPFVAFERYILMHVFFRTSYILRDVTRNSYAKMARWTMLLAIVIQMAHLYVDESGDSSARVLFAIMGTISAVWIYELARFPDRPMRPIMWMQSFFFWKLFLVDVASAILTPVTIYTLYFDLLFVLAESMMIMGLAEETLEG
jgi:hypothetical protein